MLPFKTSGKNAERATPSLSRDNHWHSYLQSGLSCPVRFHLVWDIKKQRKLRPLLANKVLCIYDRDRSRNQAFDFPTPGEDCNPAEMSKNSKSVRPVIAQSRPRRSSDFLPQDRVTCGPCLD